MQQAAKDFGTIFSAYRVYVLVLPAARIAADADRATTTAIPALTADAAKAQARVNPGNQAELQPLIDDLNSQISTATNATNGLAATVLAFTPAQWNADHGLLGPSKSVGAGGSRGAREGPIRRQTDSAGPQGHDDHDRLTSGGPPASSGEQRRPVSTFTPWSGTRPGTRRIRPDPRDRSPRRSRST